MKRHGWIDLEFYLAVGLLTLALGCARAKTAPPPPARPAADPKIEQIKAQAERQDPFLRTQTDVALDARLTLNGTVQVTIENKTTHPLVIGPKFFGVIPVGEKKIIPASPLSLKTFPISTLAPGTQASGELIFSLDRLGRGARLVFSIPDPGLCRPAMTPIQ